MKSPINTLSNFKRQMSDKPMAIIRHHFGQVKSRSLCWKQSKLVTGNINDFSNSWNGGDVAYVMGISDPDQKKGVKSQKGETFTAHKSKRRRKMYAKGGLLCTITLRYCSTLGLIHAGILPKPPMWDLHRLANPADDNGQEKPKPKSTVKGEGGDKVEVS